MSSLVSDLLGASARRMLNALAEGETNPAALAALADQRLRATPAQLCDALGACTELNPVYRRLLKMALEEFRFVEQQIGQLEQEMASLLRQHQDAVQRLAEVPGLGVDSAQQIFGYSHDFQEPSWVPFVLPFVGFDWSNYWPIGGLLGDIIDHPGDWCTVQLYIDPDQSAPDQAILAIYHYAHALQFRFEIQPATTRGPIPGSQYQIEQLQGPNAGRAVSFPDKGGDATAAYNAAQDNLVQIARVSATAPYTHPVVYVEWGGHEFWPTTAWSLTGAGNPAENAHSHPRLRRKGFASPRDSSAPSTAVGRSCRPSPP